MFQLPLSWPSELVRKYKQKNQRKILMNKMNSQNRLLREDTEMQRNSYDNDNENYKENNIIEDNKFIDEKNYLRKGNENRLKNQDSEFVSENKSILDQEIEIEKNYDLIEDEDDFIIGRKLKKMNEITEKERYCEDLHGWDED
jgi:hypothetical protein